MISPSSPQLQTYFLYLGVVTGKPKTPLIPSKVESTNTPSLNPKILLTGQILASSRDQGPQLMLALGWENPKGPRAASHLTWSLFSPPPNAQVLTLGLKGYKSSPDSSLGLRLGRSLLEQRFA